MTKQRVYPNNFTEYSYTHSCIVDCNLAVPEILCLHHHHQHYCSTLSQTAPIYFLFRLPKRLKSHLQTSFVCNLHFIHLDTLFVCNLHFIHLDTLRVRNKILSEAHKMRIMFTMKPVSWKNVDTYNFNLIEDCNSALKMFWPKVAKSQSKAGL
jgi:hypothetical protein